MKKTEKISGTRRMTGMAILTAIVIVLQLAGSDSCSGQWCCSPVMQPLFWQLIP